MQPARPKSGYSNTKATPKHDLGMSYMTSSSFNDSNMMDVSAVNTKIIPKPPNDRLIHISTCQNDKCPLQQVWKNECSIQNPNNYNREDKEFGQQFIPYYPCSKCTADVAKYCSQRCCQQHWFSTHQFICSG